MSGPTQAQDVRCPRCNRLLIDINLVVHLQERDLIDGKVQYLDAIEDVQPPQTVGVMCCCGYEEISKTAMKKALKELDLPTF